MSTAKRQREAGHAAGASPTLACAKEPLREPSNDKWEMSENNGGRERPFNFSLCLIKFGTGAKSVGFVVYSCCRST